MNTYHVTQHVHVGYTDKQDKSFSKVTFPDYVRSMNICKDVKYALLTHGLDVQEVTQQSDQYIHADTIMTNDPQIGLSMTVGDCLAVVVSDETSGAYMIIHAGWKNLVQEVIGHALSVFSQTYTINKNTTHVWVSPSLHVCCNRWDDTRPYDGKPLWSKCITKKEDGYHVDMQLYVKLACTQFGISEKNIVISPDCTYHEDKKYFSHRRSVETQDKLQDGRMGIVVWKTQ